MKLALVVLALAVAGFFGWATARLSSPIEVKNVAAPGPGDVEHGRTLALQTLICSECHGPDLGGQVMLDDAPGFVSAPDLTRHRSFETWDRAIRHGVAEDGRPLVVMPSDGYSKLSVQDLRDLVAYLEQLPAASHDVKPTKLSALGIALAATGKFHVPALSLDHAAVANTVTEAPDRGWYLVDVSGCRGCHGPTLEGRSMGPGLPTAPSLTRQTLLANGQTSFLAAMREGRRHDGQPLNAIMPWKTFGTWPAEDLEALWSALTVQH